MNYVPSKKLLKICKDFAETVQPTNSAKYSNRNQYNSSKRQDDCFVGKLGEYLVWQYLIAKKFQCSEPDIKIYEKTKSYEVDLNCPPFRIAVKSTRSKSNIPLSWVFQHGYRDYDKELFLEPNEDNTGPAKQAANTDDIYIAFCEVLSDDSVDMKCIISLSALISNDLFKHPVIDRLRDNKRVVYFRDIPEKLINEEECLFYKKLENYNYTDIRARS